MDFMTPEEFFLDAPIGSRCDKHKPPTPVVTSDYSEILTELTTCMRVPHQRDMAIFLVGPPGVGKSTLPNN